MTATASRRRASWSRSRPRRSTSCGRCSLSGCAGRCGTPTTTCRTTGRCSTPPRSTPTTARTWPTWRSSRSPPRRRCATTTRSACSRCRASRWSRVHASSGTTGRPTVVGYTAADIDTWATRHGPLDPRRGRPPRAHRARRLRLRPVHRRARRALRRREARLHRGPGLRRHDRAAGHADPRLPAGRHHGHPVLHARHHRRDGAPGHRPGALLAASTASSAPSRGPTRCAPRWRPAPASTPPTSTACPR